MMLEMKSVVVNCEQIGFRHKRRNVEDKKKVYCSICKRLLFLSEFWIIHNFRGSFQAITSDKPGNTFKQRFWNIQILENLKQQISKEKNSLPLKECISINR